MTVHPVRVVAIIAAYNEADIIGQVLRHLIGQGLAVYVIDHSSTDDTAAIARSFLDRGVLKVEQFPMDSGFPEADKEKFTWAKLLQRKEQLAATLAADWVMHYDADEIRESPWLGLNLAEAIAVVDRLGYNAIDFQVFNFAPDRDGFSAADDPREFFGYYVPLPVYDFQQIKCWKRQPEISLAARGGHEAVFPGRLVFPVRFMLRHYPLRSQAQAEKKIHRERLPRLIAEEQALGWHVQYEGWAPGQSVIRAPDTMTRFVREQVLAELATQPRDSGARAEERQYAAARKAELARHYAGLERLAEERLREIRGFEVEGRRAAAHVVELTAQITSLREQAGAGEKDRQLAAAHIAKLTAYISELERLAAGKKADA